MALSPPAHQRVTQTVSPRSAERISQMRILAISDISWNFTSLQKLTGQIEKIQPDLVLLAGDLVNDMIGISDGKVFSAQKYWDNVYSLLDFLNERKIQTFCIRGNWDNSQKYDRIIKLASKKLSYVKEISEKIVEFEGIRILGLSHTFTNSLEDIRLLSENFHEQLDLVLAHAEYKRRIWLFHLNAKLIITGHFDRQFCQIQDKVLISLERFPGQYALIDYKPAHYDIRYFDEGLLKPVMRKARYAKGELAWKTNPYQHLRPYADDVESLMAAKTQLGLDKSKRDKIVNALLKRGIAKRHIEEYLRISLRSKKKAG